MWCLNVTFGRIYGLFEDSGSASIFFRCRTSKGHFVQAFFARQEPWQRQAHPIWLSGQRFPKDLFDRIDQRSLLPNSEGFPVGA
jgi:hypothetical protein